jgi:hypothetical protein
MRSPAALSIVALSAAFAIAAPLAQAQQTEAPSQPPSASVPAKPAADLSDKKLDAAAAAVKGVTAVKEAYQQKLSEASDGDKERIVDEAQAAMTKAVTDQGLSVDEYTAILQVAQNDTAVKNKILERLK